MPEGTKQIEEHLVPPEVLKEFREKLEEDSRLWVDHVVYQLRKGEK